MKKEKKQTALFFYTFLCACFLVDMICFAFLERPLIYAVLCFYIITCIRSFKSVRIVTGLFLIALESFIYSGRFGITFLTLIPITLIALHVRHFLYESRWISYALLLIALLLQIVFIEYFLLHLRISIPYTISQIIANMIIMVLIRSLK